MSSPGKPYVTVPTVRTYDVVPVVYDWHDFLVNHRYPGRAVSVDDRIRPLRAQATGFQLKCTVAGVASYLTELVWPTKAGVIIHDGSVTWVSEALSDASMRTTISSHSFVVPSPLTNSETGLSDYMSSLRVQGFVDLATYEVEGRIVCANGEHKEAVAVIPVKD